MDPAGSSTAVPPYDAPSSPREPLSSKLTLSTPMVLIVNLLALKRARIW